MVVDEVALHVCVAIRTAGGVGDLKIVGNGVASDRVLLVEVCLDAEAILPT